MQAEGMILSMMLANLVCTLYLFIRLKLYKYIDLGLVDKKLIKDMNRYSIPLKNKVGSLVKRLSNTKNK